jgi:hypothetical protein
MIHLTSGKNYWPQSERAISPRELRASCVYIDDPFPAQTPKPSSSYLWIKSQLLLQLWQSPKDSTALKARSVAGQTPTKTPPKIPAFLSYYSLFRCDKPRQSVRRANTRIEKESHCPCLSVCPALRILPPILARHVWSRPAPSRRL